MAVAFSTVRNAVPSTTANLALSTSFTCTGVDTALLFDISLHSTTVSVTSVTWSAGGTPTRVKRQASSSGAVAEIWGVIPTNGSGSATAHFSASVLCAGSLCLFVNADQTTPFPTADAVSSTSTAASVTLTPANLGANDASNGIAVNVINGNWNTLTTNQRTVDNASDPGHILGDSAGTTAIVITSDSGITTGHAALAAVRIKATAAAAGAVGYGPLIGGIRNHDPLAYLNYFRALEWLI
jgi:hypothetical protein